MSRSRNKRYYDDSDDMVERIRRAREAFEKKANAFQGPDWPYYDKRIIQGKKTKEEFLAAQAQAESAVDPASSETTPASSQPNNVPEKCPGDDRRSNILMVGRSTRSSENLGNRRHERSANQGQPTTPTTRPSRETRHPTRRPARCEAAGSRSPAPTADIERIRTDTDTCSGVSAHPARRKTSETGQRKPCPLHCAAAAGSLHRTRPRSRRQTPSSRASPTAYTRGHCNQYSRPPASPGRTNLARRNRSLPGARGEEILRGQSMAGDERALQNGPPIFAKSGT